MKKSSAKRRPVVRVRDMKPTKDAMGGLGDIKGESTDDKHKGEVERRP
jgi:hypothetical protein